MTDEKKQSNNQQPSPLRESVVDFGENVRIADLTYKIEVSNTMPAPPNPHRNDETADKKG